MRGVRSITRRWKEHDYAPIGVSAKEKVNDGWRGVKSLSAAPAKEKVNDGWSCFKSLFTLRGGNYVAAAFHFIFFVCIFVLGVADEAPYELQLRTFWPAPNLTAAVNPLFLNATCDCTVGGSCCSTTPCDDFFEWSDCLRAQNPAIFERDNEERAERRQLLLKPETQNRGEPVRVWVLLAIFEFITFAVHLALASRGSRYCLWGYYVTTWGLNDRYEEVLANCMQPFRWLEYSVTSSIMVVCLLALSRVLDVFTVTGFFFGSAFSCLAGGLGFEVCSYFLRCWRKTNDEKAKKWCRSVYWLRAYLYVLSWAPPIATYVAIFASYEHIVQPYIELPGGVGPLWEQLFGFIRWLNIAMCAAYASFPIAHLWQAWYILDPKKCVKQYRRCEGAFIFLSFLSKGILVGTVFVAALRRTD